MRLALEKIRLPLGARELSLDCALEGRIVAIFGSSGAGKTTLLEIIAGLRRPETGRIVLGDRLLCDCSTHHWTPARRRRIGYVPQDLSLFPHLNVRANLGYGRPAAPDDRKFSAVCEVLELSPLLDRAPANLSGGEKQRVAFARAMLAEPELLLLDEPLSSLDQSLKERIFPYLLRIRDELGIPMLYVTHSTDEVKLLCDHMLVLDSGRIAAQGSPAALLVPASETRYRLRPPH